MQAPLLVRWVLQCTHGWARPRAHAMHMRSDHPQRMHANHTAAHACAVCANERSATCVDAFVPLGMRMLRTRAWCADKYISSELNATICPGSASRITQEEPCSLAAAAAEVPFGNTDVLESYPRGCIWASYGNNSVQRVWLNNPLLGRQNPGSRLVCISESCDAGTYRTITLRNVTGCSDCVIGTYQENVNQRSCKPCAKGQYGLHGRAVSEADGCSPCPAGTYQDEVTPGGTCSVCPPGTASNTSGMVSCNADACPGPDLNARAAACPGGSASPYTDAQLSLAQSLLPMSTKPLIEKQCQTSAPKLLHQDGGAVAGGASTPSGLRSPVKVGLIAALLAVAAVILMLHGFIPERLWSNVDITAQFHMVPQGGSPVNRNTQLGAAFTFALVFLAAALATSLDAANEVQESSALVPLKGDAVGTKLRVSVTLPLGDPLGSNTSYCGSIAYLPNLFKGMSCANTGAVSFGTSCGFVLTGCTFTNPSAKLTFRVPWSERFVKWSVAVDSTFEATEHSLSGVVTSGGASDLISAKHEVVVAMRAQQALLNDTTNAKLTRAGFELKHLPCTPPQAAEWNLTSSDLAWTFTIELRASENLYETVRFRKQDPLTLAMSILSAVVSMMGIWKSIFSWVEGPVSTLRERCTRRRRMRKERRDSGIEMNGEQAMLAKVLSESSKPVAAANRSDLADALKKERNERMEAIEDMLHSMKQLQQTDQQQQLAAQQQQLTIQQQQLTIQQLEQTGQQQQLTIQQLQQTVQQLQAAIASLRGA
jgi:hypothetical protein